MKNYELIALLMEQPAGAEVRFCGGVSEKNIDEPEEGYCVVTSEIKDIDAANGIINLFG